MLSERLYYEIGLFVTLQKNNQALKELEIIEHDPLTFKLTLNIKTFDYHFEVVFPRFFPFQPIIINNKEPKRLSKHEYNDKTMCLKWGIDNWNENITVKKMIINLIELLFIENPYGDDHGVAESGDKFTFSQIISSGDTLLVDLETMGRFSKPKGFGEIMIKETPSYNLYFIDKIDNEKIKHLVRPREKKKQFIYWMFEEKSDEMVISKKEIFKNYFEDRDICFIFFKGDRRIRIYRKEIITLEKKKKMIEQIPEENRESFLSGEITEYFELNIRYTEEEQEKRLKINKNILNKKIAIMGLGSIGSRVLMDLARAGFDNFLLCDGDIFLPNNIIRHELDASHIGDLKVEALSKKVNKTINKNAKFEFFTFALNGQESAAHTNMLLNQLSSCDLIIDCTADSNLIFSLNEIVKQKDINYISGSVLNGGVGNVLIKREKGSDLSLIDIVESQKKFFSINNFDFSKTQDYTGKIGDTEYIATMSDCSIIAGLIGKNAITMLSNNKNEILKNDIYVMSTSNSFLDEAYACYPLIANKRDYTPVKRSKAMIALGKRYYENNYSSKNNQNNI